MWSKRMKQLKPLTGWGCRRTGSVLEHIRTVWCDWGGQIIHRWVFFLRPSKQTLGHLILEAQHSQPMNRRLERRLCHRGRSHLVQCHVRQVGSHAAGVLLWAGPRVAVQGQHLLQRKLTGLEGDGGRPEKTSSHLKDQRSQLPLSPK